MITGYLKENPVRDGKDVNAMMCDMMSVILAGALDGDLEEELGYYKYDYLNGLKNIGVKDILIFCTDSLTGFSQAISAVLSTR